MPQCQKICESCGETGKYYTNAKRCDHCGEMSLQLFKVSETPCSARKENPGGLCTYHICRLNEGHEDNHECACGHRWP